jgi:hypothetical protein
MKVWSEGSSAVSAGNDNMRSICWRCAENSFAFLPFFLYLRYDSLIGAQILLRRVETFRSGVQIKPFEKPLSHRE